MLGHSTLDNDSNFCCFFSFSFFVLIGQRTAKLYLLFNKKVQTEGSLTSCLLSHDFMIRCDRSIFVFLCNVFNVIVNII